MRELTKIHNAVADLQGEPGMQVRIGRRDSQMLYGEPFEIVAEKDGWLQGRSILDGYAGWIDAAHKGLDQELPTHVVHTRMTNAYLLPDFKTRPYEEFSFMSRITVDPAEPAQNGFVKIKGRQAWVPQTHVMDIITLLSNKVDIAATAEMFMGTPYLYGGRSAGGIDCSALVQLAVLRNGGFCLRDADQQEPVMGKIVKRPRRGDLIYFKDGPALHVGIMADTKHIINATVRHMAVTVEKLDEMQKFYGGIKSIRRLTP
ncbi:MAG: family lipoprotein [Micavibrio sp.]|nr:family lipoprotein [Micavibrio sp.]